MTTETQQALTALHADHQTLLDQNSELAVELHALRGQVAETKQVVERLAASQDLQNQALTVIVTSLRLAIIREKLT